MAGAPKGNRNALKHGLYAGRTTIVTVVEGQLRKPEFAVRYLENTIDEIYTRMQSAQGERFTRLANALALATTALFNGHRTMAYLSGGMTPIEDALKEVLALDFKED